ncbi:MAG: PilZ domain-containing protein [Treponema sp.]|jgi:DNA-binding response OmpR family regulator|nr:PilZ domain-containing protein [Treponema sp.]
MSETNDNSDIVGRKIFFLYPNAAVQNKIVTELAQQEYEVYIAKNKDKLKKVLRKYPDSIVFIDINEHMPEKEWDIWITGLMDAADTKNISIGIVTANDDEQIKNKYLTVIKVACGYTVLKFDLEKATTHIVTILQDINAKGRRKYLRATTEMETNTTINLPVNGNFINGQIRDVSVVGISCTLEGSPSITKNAILKNIQIKLQTNLLKVEGIVFGSRTEGVDTVYVILFTQRIDPEVRIKIRKYIQQNLQSKMDFDLNG